MSTHMNFFFPASSFYPGRGVNSCELSSLNHGNSGFHTPQVDDEGSETEEDPSDEEPSLELALKFPNKFSKSLGVEVSLLNSTSTD
jgi:hypothetical protein